MFDIHCHFLPGIDDGPDTLEQSLQMVDMAVQNGITHAVVTPHIIPGRYDNSLKSISESFTQFNKELVNRHTEIKLGMAAEIRLDPIIMKMVEENKLPCLGKYHGKKVFLLEFPHDVVPQGSLEMVDWLSKKNITPVIAHPERNQAIINNINILDPFLKKHCLLQITAASLTGVFGKDPQKTGTRLLKNHQVFAIASDAHNLHKRVPDLQQGLLAAEKIIGKKQAQRLVVDNPRELTHSLFLN